MEKYFMIKTEGHVLVITIMQCPESKVVCLECDTEEEVYRLIRKMDCEITFAQPFHWRHSGQSVWRGRKADFFFVKEGAFSGVSILNSSVGSRRREAIASCLWIMPGNCCCRSISRRLLPIYRFRILFGYIVLISSI